MRQILSSLSSAALFSVFFGLAACSGGKGSADPSDAETGNFDQAVAASPSREGSSPTSLTSGNPEGDSGAAEKSAVASPGEAEVKYVTLVTTGQPLYLASAAMAGVDFTDLNQKTTCHQRYAMLLNQTGGTEVTAEQLQASWDKNLGALKIKEIAASKENLAKFLAFVRENDKVLVGQANLQNQFLGFVKSEYAAFKDTPDSSADGMRKKFLAASEMFGILRDRVATAAHIYGVEVFPVSAFEYAVEKKNYSGYVEDLAALTDPIRDRLLFFQESQDVQTGFVHKFPIKPALVAFFEGFLVDAYSKATLGFVNGSKEIQHLSIFTAEFTDGKPSPFGLATLKIGAGNLEDFHLFSKAD